MFKGNIPVHAPYIGSRTVGSRTQPSSHILLNTNSTLLIVYFYSSLLDIQLVYQAKSLESATLSQKSRLIDSVSRSMWGVSRYASWPPTTLHSYINMYFETLVTDVPTQL